MLAFGPLKISTAINSPDGIHKMFPGDENTLLCQIVDATGRPINCAGATMTALVTDSDGDTAVTPAVTEGWADLGEFTVAFDAPSTAGSYQLTIRRNGGDGDIQTAGPLIIQVCTR
jgi:hypothetical protein